MSSTEPEISGGGPVAALPAVTGVGSVLGGHYRLDEVAGRGGMATVYRAHDLQHHRSVAVKVLDATRLSTVDAARFQGEIDVLARLQHPHVLPLLDSGTIDGARYLVTPFIAGESLARRLAREQRLPLDEAVRLTRQVASALTHAHSIGVVHRDITPGNILLSNGLAVVADFGIARLAEPVAGAVTETGFTIGTPAYMSPEQASGDGPLDARSDVYALGCVLYAMLTGKPPFAEYPVQQSLTKRMLELPPRPSAQRPDVPMVLDAVLLTALAPLPEHRWQSAQAFDTALAGVEVELASASRPHTKTVTRVTPVRPSSRRRWIAAGLGVAALGAIGAWLLTRTPRVDASTIAVVVPPGDTLAPVLRDVVSRWSDVSVQSVNAPGDALSTVAGARALARSAGAGRLVWGTFTRLDGAPAVRLHAVDGAAGDGTRAIASTVRVDAVGGAAAAVKLALDSVMGVAVGSEAAPSTSLAAQRAYAEGMGAFRRWSMDTAVATLRRVVAMDSLHAPAQLALAQAFVWLGDSTRADARDAAERLAIVAPRLSGRAQAAALAIVAMGRGELPQACGQYRELVRGDSTDASAWLGLGLCQQRDSVVVADARSPSGYAFRSSWWGAANAMERALGLMPAAHHRFGFRWLSANLLFVDGIGRRPGLSGAAEGGQFIGTPMLVSDTVGFVPWSYAAVQTAAAEFEPRSFAQALDRHRARLYRIAATARRNCPTSPSCLESFALALESVGELGQDGSPSQIDSVVTSAVAVASDEEQRVRLGILRTRVALKRLQFAMAARLADSTLARAPVTGSLQHLRSISALYALRGRAEDAAKAMERAADVEATRADASQRTAQGLRREVARLTVFAAVGMRDSIAASVERVEMQMQQWIPPQQQAAWRDAALTQPAALASSSLGRLVEWSPRPAGRYLLALRYDADRGNATGVRARLAALDRARAAYRPSDISLDAVVSEARARLDIGDTTAAVASLDGAIRSLPARLGSLLRDASSAASLVQLMRLRGAVGGPTAARWRAAADTLWSR